MRGSLVEEECSEYRYQRGERIGDATPTSGAKERRTTAKFQRRAPSLTLASSGHVEAPGRCPNFALTRNNVRTPNGIRTRAATLKGLLCEPLTVHGSRRGATP